MNGIVAQLQDHYPDAAFMVFNFKEGERRSQLSDLLSQYDMTVMDYPRQYEGCPLLPLEMIHHFLRSSESWLSLEGQQNVLLMHCERGGWPMLAFMLAGLLLYRKQYTGEQKTLEMVYKQAPRELLHLLSPLNPQPSQVRYLQYISRRIFGSEWPPSDKPLALDCIILRVLPPLGSGRGCRPVVHVYGQDPSVKSSSRSSKLLFSSSKVKKNIRFYRKEECDLVKIDIHCRVQGDIVLECIHLEDDTLREETIFRIMFHTAFVRSNVMLLTRDDVDVLWDAKDQFPRDFRAEVLFSNADSVASIITTKEAACEDGNEAEINSPEEFFEAEEIFSSVEPDNHTVKPTSPDNGNHHEVSLKDGYNYHAYEDCASDEGIQGHERALHQDKIMLPNGDSQLDSNNGKLEGERDKQNEEDAPSVAKHKLAADNNIKKGVSTVMNKQMVASSSSKSASDSVDTNKKSKKQDTQGLTLRKAKPDAVSRWIPSNKGSYTNSMHVYYPPSARHNSAPPPPATTGKGASTGGKSKAQFLIPSSEKEKPATAEKSSTPSRSNPGT
ncbi:Formin-like protein 20 [Striga hermonthica]|uniref:Formin-like protein 20 n=1 Tax=Striga hermonthica TaxID=68872 RepID=A0A9N7N2J7_STRHE|nr:Formin-like protein 20 [Striga hermonthica]